MTSEVLLQEFDAITNAPNGAQKIRELVLEFAVHGRLVPQDPRDEPAAVLLARILAAKERLLQEGKIRAMRSSRPVGQDESPRELPQGWQWSRLETLGTVNPRNSLPDDLTVAFCPMASIPDTYRGDVSLEKRVWRDVKTGFTHFAEGDVVLAKITPCFQNGKAAVMRNLPGQAGAGTTELHVFRPVPGTIVPDYVLIFLKSPGFVSGGVRTMTGTAGQQRVSKDYFALSPFPLPPYEEQRRIVAKVDQLMGLCDQLETRQARARATAAHLAASVLHRVTTA